MDGVVFGAWNCLNCVKPDPLPKLTWQLPGSQRLACWGGLLIIIICGITQKLSAKGEQMNLDSVRSHKYLKREEGGGGEVDKKKWHVTNQYTLGCLFLFCLRCHT